LATSLGYITLLVVLRGVGIALVVQNAQVAALTDVPPMRLTRATPLYSATQQTLQAIGVAVLATILATAVTVTLPKGAGGAPGGLSKLPTPVREAALAALRQFQGQYITGLDHAYMAAFAVSIVATLLALFLPGWPGAYRRRAQAVAPGVEAPVPQAVAESV